MFILSKYQHAKGEAGLKISQDFLLRARKVLGGWFISCDLENGLIIREDGWWKHWTYLRDIRTEYTGFQGEIMMAWVSGSGNWLCVELFGRNAEVFTRLPSARQRVPASVFFGDSCKG